MTGTWPYIVGSQNAALWGDSEQKSHFEETALKGIMYSVIGVYFQQCMFQISGPRGTQRGYVRR